jgi:hypothetical protein
MRVLCLCVCVVRKMEEVSSGWDVLDSGELSVCITKRKDLQRSCPH